MLLLNMRFYSNRSNSNDNFLKEIGIIIALPLQLFIAEFLILSL
jgi:hypothetical protein